MPADLDRFKTAQRDPYAGFDVALRELEAGRKRTHWIWYVFPQLAGLGSSAMAMRYGVRGMPEARDYLADPQLRARLAAVTRVLAAHLRRRPAPRLDDLMGSGVDARKVVSSLTLFRAAAGHVRASEDLDGAAAALAADAEVVLEAAATQGLPACTFTIEEARRGIEGG